MTYTFDVTKFRTMFAEYSDVLKYPDATLQEYWNMAIVYILNEDEMLLCGVQRETALYLMTAHVTALSDNIASKVSAGIEISSSIGDVSVSMMPPPIKDGWQFWLSQTARGQQLWALLVANIVGGFSVGGIPQAPAFRNSWGGFY